jgi:hypothetical protein
MNQRLGPASRQKAMISVALEILDLAFVLFGGLAGIERPQVAALAGFGVFLAGIEAVFAAGKLADHGSHPFMIANGLHARAFLL